MSDLCYLRKTRIVNSNNTLCILPGICEPYESEKCQAANDFEVCQEQEFICPLKDEEGTPKCILVALFGA